MGATVGMSGIFGDRPVRGGILYQTAASMFIFMFMLDFILLDIEHIAYA